MISVLEPQYSRRDYDEPWEHWKRCAHCEEPVNPDESVTLHGDVYHDYCGVDACKDTDCEGHDDD